MRLSQLIILCAFVLRLAACFMPDVWYDEAFSVSVAALPVREIIAFQATDFNPPLWDVLLHPFISLWHSVFMIRLVALIFSTLSMLLAWRIMRHLAFTQTQINFALLMIGFLPGLIWMSSDGRNYAFLTFLYLVSIWAVLQERPVLLGAASVLMLYTHVVSAFLIGGVFLWALLRGVSWRTLFMVGAGVLLLWSPWIAVMITHPKADPFYWVRLTPVHVLTQLTMAYWIGSSLFLWIAGWIMVGITFGVDPRSSALVLSPLLFFVLAALIANVITYRTLSPIVLPYAILLGWLAPKRTVLALLWLACLILGVATYDFELKGSRQEQAARMIAGRPAQVVYATLTVALPFDYYLHEPNSCILQLEPDGALINPAYLFGFERCTPDHLADPFWLVLPDEPMIPPDAFEQMQDLASAGQLVTELHYVQMAPVGVYLVGGDQ